MKIKRFGLTSEPLTEADLWIFHYDTDQGYFIQENLLENDLPEKVRREVFAHLAEKSWEKLHEKVEWWKQIP